MHSQVGSWSPMSARHTLRGPATSATCPKVPVQASLSGPAVTRPDRLIQTARVGPGSLATIRRVPPTTFRGGEILGIRIPTVFDENDGKVCAGCGQPIDGTPFRISLLDTVSAEVPDSWARHARLNPGPHQFHADPACFRAWARGRGLFFCRLSEVREIMRPVAIPGDSPRWGACDGVHRQAHEFVLA